LPGFAAEAFIFPSARRRNGADWKGPIRTDNYRARVLQPLAKKLGLPKLNFQVLRRTMATLAQSKGGVKDIQAILGHSKPDITAACYMQPIAESVKQTQEAIYQELVAPLTQTGGVKKTENLVRFGTVGFVGGPQVIESERLGA
jgi:integrase